LFQQGIVIHKRAFGFCAFPQLTVEVFKSVSRTSRASAKNASIRFAQNDTRKRAVCSQGRCHPEAQPKDLAAANRHATLRHSPAFSHRSANTLNAFVFSCGWEDF